MFDEANTITTEDIRTIASCISALAAAVGVPLLFSQLKGRREDALQARAEAKKWATLEACKVVEENVMLAKAADHIWEHSSSSTVFDETTKENAEREILLLLNYLDGIAIGLKQKLYEPAIVRDQLGPYFRRYVEVFLSDKTESAPNEPRPWKCTGDAFPLLKSGAREEAYPHLLETYSDWYGKPTTTHYEDK